MADGNILLELDGSAQARYAAEVAWALAKANNCKVDAQHVIDSLAAWDFLAFDIAGFIGSGPYFEAHESMRGCLNTIGTNLIDVYNKLAKQNQVEGEAFLDDGATIREICTRAANYDVVIMGHQSTGMGSPDEDKRKLPRRSVTETLTHYIDRPLLLVQDRCRMWSKARILLGETEVPVELLKSCLDFIGQLSIEPSVRLLFKADGSTKVDKTSPDGMRATTDVSKALPEVDKSRIDVKSVKDFNEYLQKDAEQEGDVLLVVPVIEENGVRKTAFNLTPEAMVRYLNHPSVLFWIQGGESKPASKKSKSASAVS